MTDEREMSGDEFLATVLTVNQSDQLAENAPKCDSDKLKDIICRDGIGRVLEYGRAFGIFLATMFCLLLGLDNLAAQPPKPEFKPAETVKVKDKTYATGRVQRPDLVTLKKKALLRNGWAVAKFPKVSAPTWDCYQLGIVPPIRDQGNCGSCWDFSGTRVVTCALIKAGYGKADGSFYLSEQYTLDCGRNGGCNGDDNVTVLDWAKKTGLPTDADYGPYTAHPGRCKSGVKLIPIKDWGFCDGGSGNGVATVDQIKAAIAQYGPVGAGIDAGVLGDGTGIISGRGHSINHDITITGWDDTKVPAGSPPGATVWIMDNSWGAGWGQKINGLPGRCYIVSGSGDIGTEAVWATATPITPPAEAPVINSPLTITAPLGTTFTYQITATNTPTSYDAAGLPPGIAVDKVTGKITGVPTTPGSFSVTIAAINAGGTGSATLALTVGTGPVPPGPQPTPTADITLSNDLPAGTYKIVPKDAEIIHSGMAVEAFFAAVSRITKADIAGKGKVVEAKSCCDPSKTIDDRLKLLEAASKQRDEDIAEIRRATAAIMKALAVKEKQPSSDSKK